MCENERDTSTYLVHCIVPRTGVGRLAKFYAQCVEFFLRNTCEG